MKQVSAAALNSLADYQIQEAPAPLPEPGSVQIKVHACGVGYVDALVALGRYQVKPLLPHVPGQEIGGDVQALGTGVVGLAVGDRVMAQVRGGFAEFAVAAETAVMVIPAQMSFAQAACFRINYLTALHGLRDRANLQAGETLVVLGAAGGVGSAAIQVGKRLGARVIAVASTAEKRAFAQALGADEVIDAGAEGFRDRIRALCAAHGPDVVFDPVCGPLFEPAFRSMGWRGRHLVIGFVGGPIPALPANLPLLKGAALVGVDVRQFVLFEPERANSHLREMLEWVAQGSLKPPVGKVFSFDEFGAALEYAFSGQGQGKSVLNVASPNERRKMERVVC